jgi:glycosyltransferase involved in cell wall biosynthesis
MKRDSEDKTLLFVLPSLEVGGSESQAISLALMLRNRGWNPIFLILNNPGEWSEILDKNSVLWKSFEVNIRKNPLKGLIKFFSAGRFVVRMKPVILYSLLLESNIFGYFLIKLFAKQTLHVVGIRGLLPLRSTLVNSLFLLTVNHASLLILNSNHLMKNIPDSLNDFTKIITINNAVDVQDSSKPFSGRVPTFAVLANFHNYKGHDLLVEALMSVETKIRVHFIGDGPKLESTQQAAFKLPEHVETFFHGRAANPFFYLLHSHFLVLPSRHEGFPNAVLEAMSIGLPVICFDIPGLDQLVTENETGILVKPFDVKLLGRAIDKLASNRDLRILFGRNAQRKSKDYSWEKVADEFSSAFSLVLREL